MILCRNSLSIFFFQESYNGNRERSLEDKSPRHPYEVGAKKARSSFESQPQVFSGHAGGGDPYGLFLAVAMAGGGKGQVHPAALAAWSNYQAIKVHTPKSKSILIQRPLNLRTEHFPIYSFYKIKTEGTDLGRISGPFGWNHNHNFLWLLPNFFVWSPPCLYASSVKKKLLMILKSPHQDFLWGVKLYFDPSRSWSLSCSNTAILDKFRILAYIQAKNF